MNGPVSSATQVIQWNSNAFSGAVVGKADVTAASGDFAATAIGTGPFKLDSWVPDEKTILSANADWSVLNAAFTTAANTEAVTIQLVRETCKGIVCPITGKVRFDDFSLKQ